MQTSDPVPSPLSEIKACREALLANARPEEVVKRLRAIESQVRSDPALYGQWLLAKGIAGNRMRLRGEALGDLSEAADIFAQSGDAAHLAEAKREAAVAHAWCGEGREAGLGAFARHGGKHRRQRHDRRGDGRDRSGAPRNRNGPAAVRGAFVRKGAFDRRRASARRAEAPHGSQSIAGDRRSGAQQPSAPRRRAALSRQDRARSCFGYSAPSFSLRAGRCPLRLPARPIR